MLNAIPTITKGLQSPLSQNSSQSYRARNFVKLRKPSYYCELAKFPNTNPILIATNWQIGRYFKRLKSFCLVCETSYQYNFEFVTGREVWILYSDSEGFSYAENLGFEAQVANAIKVTLIKFDSNLLRTPEVENDEFYF